MVIGWLVRRREHYKDQGRPTNHDGPGFRVGPENHPRCCLMVIAHAVQVEAPSGKGSEKSRVLRLRMTSTAWVLASSPTSGYSRPDSKASHRPSRPDRWVDGSSTRKERPTHSHKEHGLAYARVAESRIRLKCRSPYGGECTNASCCLSGTGAFPRRRGDDTRTYWLPPVPGKGMSGQPEVYRPLAGGKIVCTSPSPVSTVRAGGKVNERKNRAGSCLHQTTVHLVRSGTCHRSMAQVRVLARCFALRGFLLAAGGCGAAPGERIR